MATGLGTLTETRSLAKRDNWVHLMTAVVAQAAKELIDRKNLDEVADVVAWTLLREEDCRLYCDVANVPFEKFRELATTTELAEI